MPHEALSASPPSSQPVQVYLFRGFLPGPPPRGIDIIAAELQRRGIRVQVQSFRSGDAVAAAIIKSPSQTPRIALVGHSFGANAALRLATTVAAKGIRISLVVTLDPTEDGPLSASVGHYVNYYLPGDGYGRPLKTTASSAARVRNIDLRKRPDVMNPRLNHWALTKHPVVVAEVVAAVIRAVK